ncbi:MAG: hypothetical protein WCT31_01380 [Candidatus Micrarchaeia archaeon]|jgi:hypothetical protein
MGVEDIRETLFLVTSTTIIILGLAVLNIFGITYIQIPILMSAAILGAIARSESKLNWAYLGIAVLAGLFGAIILVNNPSTGQLVSVATGFAIAIVLPSILIEARKKFITKK